MDFLNVIKGNEVFAAALIFTLICMLNGHSRGLVRMALTAASIIISLVLANRLMPVMGSLVSQSGILDGVKESIGQKLTEGLEGPAADYSALYELFGIDELTENITTLLGSLLLNVVCFVILFLLIRLLLRFLLKFCDFITSIPVISGLNQIGGALFGFAEAIIYIWIVMAIASLTPSFGISRLILEQCRANEILKLIYDNNMLVGLLLNMR